VTPRRPRDECSGITCRECADFLHDYTGGALPAAQRAEFERHLRACPPCVAYLDTYRQTVSLARPALCGASASKPPEMPEALVRAILAARSVARPGPKKKAARKTSKRRR
jgi:anti-sigma factor RsiW